MLGVPMLCNHSRTSKIVVHSRGLPYLVIILSPVKRSIANSVGTACEVELEEAVYAGRVYRH